MIVKRLFFVLVALAFLSNPVYGSDLNLFAGTAYSADTAAMDTALGISGATIEDFEDVSLVFGLSISYTNPNGGPVTTLPTVYNEATIGLYTNNLWDGSHALISNTQNQEWNQPGIGVGTLVERITFDIAGGAAMFGIGFGNLQSDLVDHEVLVNGVAVVSALETLPNWTSGINLRNGYLRIDAMPGETINSVSFDIGNGTRDGMIFDHLAFVAVPEPTSFSLAALFGCYFLSSRRRIS